MAKKGQKQRKYSAEFKETIILDMVKTAGFRVLKTLDEFVWNSAIQLPSGLTQEYMTDLHFLTPKENLR